MHMIHFHTFYNSTSGRGGLNHHPGKSLDRLVPGLLELLVSEIAGVNHRGF